MPIIHPPPYSKKNVKWSMYKIADSKWVSKPPAEEEDYIGLPKYKKYTKNWFSRKIITISDSFNHRQSQITVIQQQISQIREQELEQARLEEARLIMFRFQELIALSRRGPPY